MAAVETSEDPDLQLVAACQAAPEEGFDGPFRALYEAYRDRVMAFSAQQHWLYFTFEGDSAMLEVRGRTGEVIERLDLAERE